MVQDTRDKSLDTDCTKCSKIGCACIGYNCPDFVRAPNSKFELPFICPSVNMAYYFTRRGPRTIKVKTEKAKKFFADVEAHLSTVDYVTFKGKLKVKLTFVWPDARRRDLDNYQKLTNDSLRGMLWLDDSQIFEITSIKQCEPGVSKTIVEVKEYD